MVKSIRSIIAGLTDWLTRTRASFRVWFFAKQFTVRYALLRFWWNRILTPLLWKTQAIIDRWCDDGRAVRWHFPIKPEDPSAEIANAIDRYDGINRHVR